MHFEMSSESAQLALPKVRCEGRGCGGLSYGCALCARCCKYTWRRKYNDVLPPPRPIVLTWPLSCRQNYVDFPKKNGYRSLHTTVVHSTGLKMEFQVRCWVHSRLGRSGGYHSPRIGELKTDYVGRDEEMPSLLARIQ